MRATVSLMIPPAALLAAWGVACSGGVTERPTLDIKPADEDTASAPDVEETDTGEAPDPGNDTPDEPDTPDPVVTYTCADPTGPTFDQACNFSVNQAVAIIPTTAGAAITLRTDQSAPNPPGAYNSPAVGNRAIVGFHDHNRTPVSELTSFLLELEKVSGSPAVAPELTLLVDLSCRAGPYRVVTATSANLGAPVTLPNGHQQFRVEANQPAWAVFDTLYAEDGTTVLLPDPDYTQGVAYGPLTNLTGVYPDACLRNLDSRDDYMPANADTSAVMVTLGRATNLIKNEWRLWRLQVGDVDHLPL